MSDKRPPSPPLSFGELEQDERTAAEQWGQRTVSPALRRAWESPPRPATGPALFRGEMLSGAGSWTIEATKASVRIVGIGALAPHEVDMLIEILQTAARRAREP